MERSEIVVGFDGSEPSRAALHHAVAQARLRDAPVRVLAAFDYNWRGSRFGGVETLEPLVRQPVETMLQDAAAEMRVTAPGLEITTAATLGAPGPALADASRTAALLVVGNRGHGGFGGLMLGSVSQYVATHAQCPVLVARGAVDPTAGPVVVGTDGSKHTEHTLRVAFDEAARRGAALIAIRACLPVPYGLMAMAPVPYDPDEVVRAVAEQLADDVQPWRDKYPEVKVETLVAHGSPGGVLVDVSGTAALVVVGSHGYGAITGTLLGSVGLQLLHHADCPVLVARQHRS